MNAFKLSFTIYSTCLQTFLLSISTKNPPIISTKSSISGTPGKGCYLTPLKFTPHFAISLTTLFITLLASDSELFSSLVLNMRLKLSVFLWGYQSLMSYKHLLLHDGDTTLHYPQATAKRNFIFSKDFMTKAVLHLFILQPLSETDAAPSMFYFHNIYILLMET